MIIGLFRFLASVAKAAVLPRTLGGIAVTMGIGAFVWMLGVPIGIVKVAAGAMIAIWVVLNGIAEHIESAGQKELA